MHDTRQDLPLEAITALEQGSKIEAIKHVRVARGVGLKEAKDIVETYIDGHPELRRRMASANMESLKGGLRWLLLLAALGVVAFYLLGGET